MTNVIEENINSTNETTMDNTPPVESNTAINEYLEIVRSEYEIERGKKESFENRVGIILALVGAMGVFLLEIVDMKEIISLFSVPMTFVILLEIISGLLVYIGLAYTLIWSFLAISAKKQANFEVKNINEGLLKEERMTALAKLVFTYRDIIVQHRGLNEKRARAFKHILIGCFITIFSAILYYSL